MSHKDKKENTNNSEGCSAEEKNPQKGHCGCDAAAECACEGSETTENCQCSSPEVEQKDVVENAADQMVHEEQNMNFDELLSRLNSVSKELDTAKKTAEISTAEAAKNRDLYLRSVADLDTYRRKVQREKDELAKFALAPLIEELLPSLDHLEMAIEAAKKANEAPALTSGVEMVSAQVHKVFENYGLKTVDAKDREFDPKLEDCVAHQPSETAPENTVISVMRKGYILNGRLLRPASVVVSCGKPKEKK